MFELGEESTYQHQQIVNLIAEKYLQLHYSLLVNCFQKQNTNTIQ